MEQHFYTYLEAELCDLLGSSFHIYGKEHIGGGCISRSMKLRTSCGYFFLKWNQVAASDMFVREAEALKELRMRAGKDLLIPEVILAADSGEFPGFIIMEFLKAGTSGEQDKKLGRGLAGLHRPVNSRFGFRNNNYCGTTLQNNSWCDNWTEFFIRNRLLDIVNRIGSGFLPGEREVFFRLAERLPKLLPGTSGASLIHGDLWSGNYLFTGKGPALIDPAAYYADREMELSMMMLFGGFSDAAWQAYRHVFPMEPGWEDRVQLYQLYHLLNHYYLFGGSYGCQALNVAGRYV
ncbi:MAG: fructosamine kinase family protein [Mangrovibacterium sp.]